MSRFSVLVKGCCVFSLALALTACGSSGGGGGGTPLAPLSLTGSVTDSDRAPVVGASVTAFNDTGTAVATVSTNAAGVYELRGLGTGTFSILAVGPVGTFPAGTTDLALTASVVPQVDIYLPSTSEVPGGPVYTLTDPANLLTATLDLTGSVVTGTPQVFLKPINVREFGSGEAAEISPLLVDPLDYLTPWYASAAVELIGATIDTADLNLPVPVSLQATAPATAALYRLDEATLAWVDTTEVANLDASSEFYTAAITAGGLYRVAGVQALTDEITGTVTYEDGTTAVAGATVYLNGVDYGYQQVVITDATGAFSGLALDGSAVDLTACRKQGGLQVCDTLSATPNADPFAAGTISLPLAAGTTTVTLASIDVANPIGIDASSGRIYLPDFVTYMEGFGENVDFTIGVSDFPSLVLQISGFSGTLVGATSPADITSAQTITVDTLDGTATVTFAAAPIDNLDNTMDVTLSVSFTP